MNFRRRMTLAVGVAVLAVSLAACSAGTVKGGAGGSTDGAGSGGQPHIALIARSFQHQYWQAVKKGAEDEAAKLGATITFEGPASETEIDTQLQMLQAAIDKNPDAIGFAALDPKACIPLYDMAKAAGIPIVEFDSGCDSDYPSSLAKTDSRAAGALAADHMAELVGSGEVGVIGHTQIGTGRERVDGFLNQMKDKYPDIKVVDVQYGDGDHLKSADIAKTIIAAYPDLKGIYGTNEGAAVGIVNAVNELGLKPGKLTLIGFDSGKAQIDAINNGSMAGAITQNPFGEGQKTIQAAMAVLNGDSVEKDVDTGTFWYDKTNMDDPKIAAVLYQ